MSFYSAEVVCPMLPRHRVINLIGLFASPTLNCAHQYSVDEIPGSTRQAYQYQIQRAEEYRLSGVSIFMLDDVWTLQRIVAEQNIVPKGDAAAPLLKIEIAYIPNVYLYEAPPYQGIDARKD